MGLPLEQTILELFPNVLEETSVDERSEELCKLLECVGAHRFSPELLRKISLQYRAIKARDASANHLVCVPSKVQLPFNPILPNLSSAARVFATHDGQAKCDAVASVL